MEESKHPIPESSINGPENSVNGMLTLNDAQKRYLTAFLATLEKVLRQVLFLLQDNNKDEIFHQKEKDISEENSLVLKYQINSLLEKFEELKSKYQLSPIKEKYSRLVTSQLSLCWAGLLDTRPKILSGYGDLPSTTAKELEEEIKFLSQKVAALINIVNQSNWSDADHK